MSIAIHLERNKKVFFSSDYHLGVPTQEASLKRERKIIDWIDQTEKEAQVYFFVGDLFDFWFDYKKVIPKGFIRFLGKLAHLKDSGKEVYIFKGNHDLWMGDYFQQELGIPVYDHPMDFKINGKLFHIAHGDGLGPGDHGYKALKKVFTNKFCQWLFRQLHPDLAMKIALYWSKNNRLLQGVEEEQFLGEEKEWLIQYAKEVLKNKHYDYFIFGHRHLPIDFDLNETSKYINLGEWLNYCSYATFDGYQVKLSYYTEGNPASTY